MGQRQHGKDAIPMVAQVRIYTIKRGMLEDKLKVYETSPERAGYTVQTGPHIAQIEVRTVENARLTSVLA